MGRKTGGWDDLHLRSGPWNIGIGFRLDKAQKQRRRQKTKKKILDVTCGSRTIWFDKHHPAAIYCDERRESVSGVWKSGKGQSERQCIVDPDIQCDFTDLPFEDNTFSLVVFDPPHLVYVGESSWLAAKYGRLGENWPQMLHGGFRECMRVLKPGRNPGLSGVVL